SNTTYRDPAGGHTNERRHPEPESRTPSSSGSQQTDTAAHPMRPGVVMTLVRPLVSLLVLVAPALAAQSAKPIPLRDFFRNPAKAYFQVSQGGKYVSYTEPYQNRMNIVVRPVAGG